MIIVGAAIAVFCVIFGMYIERRCWVKRAKDGKVRVSDGECYKVRQYNPDNGKEFFPCSKEWRLPY